MNDSLKRILAQAGPFLGLILVIALFAIPPESRDAFLSYHNFRIIFTQTVIVAIGALGMTMIIVSGGIDLSAGSNVAFASVIGALLLQTGMGAGSVAILMILVGAGIGLCNGTMIAGLRLPPFIITLGTMSAIRGFGKGAASNQTVNYPGAPALNEWMTTDPLGYAFPVGVWVALALAVATAVVLRRTVFGRQVFALGSNEATARLCGVPTTRTKILIYAIAGGLFGLAGVFQLSRLRQGDPTVAVGLELDLIASAVIGGASLSGGVGTVLGTMIGALIMAVLRNGSQQMGWPTNVQEIIIGTAIILAVFVDKLRQGKQA
ncbi:MAG: ABC transporter permease [Opitutaceae bacterium]